ncbi:MAG: hypothetical protein JW797_14155 [Bradymonadales bacterium]|nr:hypothetical protein [Bradymonadales bacterium]
MSAISLAVTPHPWLDLGAFCASFPRPLGEIPSPPWLGELLRIETPSPLLPSDEVRAAIRNLLRHGGFKPTGRSKPASEYLMGAAQKGTLAPINPAVDACNAVSLHSGLPISVIDLERTHPPLRVALGGSTDEYVFNAAAQVIDVEGLICLFDALGPCANAVKDAQRTKTHPQSTRTLSLVWGSIHLPGRTAETVAWYRDVLKRLGASTEPVILDRSF